jgi:hypothetical protein
MSIGKSSITKRVAKQAEIEKSTEKNIAPELVATVAAAPKAPAKKSSSSTAKKAAPKKAAPKKETVTEKLTPPEVDPKEKTVDTAVIANISPETVAAVIGHEEKSGFEKVQVGGKLPVHLL